MNPGRLLGLGFGIVMLAAIFLLPFGGISGLIPGGSTLYSTFYHDALIVNQPGTATSTFILMIATIILVVAGLVGIFPLFSGALGVLGMGIITIVPFAISPASVSFSPAAGFDILWVASVANIGASFWRAKQQRVEAPPPRRVVDIPPGPEEEPPTTPPGTPVEDNEGSPDAPSEK